MRLKDRPKVYQALVRAESLAVEVTGRGLAVEMRDCEEHGAQVPHFVAGAEGACEACVLRSRALAEIGRRGGQIGGKAMTRRKRAAFERAAAKRWPVKAAGS